MTLALILLALVVVIVVAYPLRTAVRERRVTTGPSQLDALLRRKAILYQNMKDLEFEYQMGKLSEADYQSLRDEDRREAAGILAQIDLLEDRGDVDAIIEREIAARSAAAESPAPPPPEPTASSDPAACASCGTPLAPGDRFCSQCGTRAGASERV